MNQFLSTTENELFLFLHPCAGKGGGKGKVHLFIVLVNQFQNEMAIVTRTRGTIKAVLICIFLSAKNVEHI